MEEEIDLRKYIIILIKNWRWIIGVSVVAAGVALIVSLILPAKYEAQALAMVTQPRYQVQFDPRFAAVQLDKQQIPYDAYSEIAASDTIHGQLLQQYRPKLPTSVQSLSDFRNLLESAQGKDPSLVKLIVTDRDPVRAATIANSWADLLVAEVNDLYANSEEDLIFFKEQLQTVEADLTEAQTAMIEFQSRNNLAMVVAELQATQNILVKHLSTQQTIEFVVEDAEQIKGRLAQRDPAERTQLADDLTALFLEVNALSSGRTLPIQLQVSDLPVDTDKTVAEQVILLDTLTTSLEAQKADVAAAIEALQPQIFQLQKEQQQITEEEDQLDQDLTLTKDLHQSLTNKVKELEIVARDSSVKQMRVASYAVPPDEPVTSKLLITGIAGLLGLIIGAIWILGQNWWQEQNTPVAELDD